jgi:hypothetical protein
MKTKALFSLLLLLLVTLSACDSALEKEPTSFIGPDNFYRNAEDARSALTGAYNRLTQGRFGGYIASYQYMRMIGKPTPEVGVGTNTPEFILDEFRWTPGATERGVLPVFYESAYKGINAANAVISNVPGIENMDPELRARFVAEARFLRALHYYQLVGVFGGVPLVRQETAGLSELQKPRAPEDSVYMAIISDLQQAASDLPPVSEYGTESGRASKGAAQALLAKVYLLRGSLNASNGVTDERQIAQPEDYQRAAELTQQVIDSDQYSLPGDAAQQFRDLFWEESSGGRNPEVIFGLVFDPGLGIGGGLPCLTVSEAAGSALAPSSWNQHTSELPFYQSFDDADLRKEMTFLTEFPNESGETVTYDVDDVENDGIPEDSPPFKKYAKAADGAGCDDDNDFVMLRYASVLLMKAEALNEVNDGPTSEAYAAINKVRGRAGLEPLSGGMDYEAFREAVYTERRKELVAEGHGWHTMQRFWDVATRRVREHAEFDAQFPPERWFGPRLDMLEIDPRDRLFPIPASAINRNPELTQNPGY